MVKEQETTGRLEWRINVAADGKQEILEAEEERLIGKVWGAVQCLIVGFVLKIQSFFGKAWNVGVSEPKKVIHGLKVGMALCFVSLFYYMRPLYDGVGGTAMWAVMTVVVAFESTVGATLNKCVNRMTGTFLAGALGVGVHWVAVHSGQKFEPIILQASVFLLTAAATFSRFIPSVKARFDYGAMIFVLTFCFVSVSGYRVDKLLNLARNRISTIAIGTSICIIVSIFLCPIWAGDELHSLITRNIQKLANSLDGCVADYFKDDSCVEEIDEDDESYKKLLGYKCVLNTKATEESMANFARWEPMHGRFNFGHPWKQYLRIGASVRKCAYCIETLNGFISSDMKMPESIKKHFGCVCLRLSSQSSLVLKELAATMSTMKKSSTIDLSVGEMNLAVQDVQNALTSLPQKLVSSPQQQQPVEASSESANGEPPKITSSFPLTDILPVAAIASTLIEIASRIEGIVQEVEELACQAGFKLATSDKKSKQKSQPSPPHNQT